MTWFSGIIPPPDSRDQLTLQTFLRDIAAPLLCYYATAVLVLTPNTALIRRITLPLSVWTFFKSATRLDVAKASQNSDRLVYLNQGLVIVNAALAMRLTAWCFCTEPLIREVTSQSNARKPAPLSSKQVLVDAFDLCCNLRGCGWNWQNRLQIPPETRPTKSTESFLFATLMSFLIHLALCDAVQYTIQWFEPTTLGSAIGGSIFDLAMPPLYRYFRSSCLTFLTGIGVYINIQAGYDIATLFGVLIFKQDISSWPPAFQTPWLSTSLTELWARRWHQLFRDIFISLGSKPMSLLFGRAGSVLGAFTLSGCFHAVGLWGMGRGTDFIRVCGFFVMNGVGIILEHLWRKFVGQRVGGRIGTIWVYFWVIGWGHMLAEAWLMRGLIGSSFVPQSMRLTTYIFGSLY